MFGIERSEFIIKLLNPAIGSRIDGYTCGGKNIARGQGVPCKLRGE
jgi:hypothetical protein